MLIAEDYFCIFYDSFDELPKSYGVYAIFILDEPLTAIYIGESENIYECLNDKNHEGRIYTEKKGYNYIIGTDTDSCEYACEGVRLNQVCYIKNKEKPLFDKDPNQNNYY